MADSIDLGSDDHGVTFAWTRSDPHIAALGTLAINVWDAEWDAAADVDLASDQALELAQWLNEQLGRD